MLLFLQLKNINNTNLLKNIYYKNVNISTRIIYQNRIDKTNTNSNIIHDNAMNYKEYRYLQLYDKYIIDNKKKVDKDNIYKLFDKNLINKNIDNK
jgi:hypothetical protein